MLDLSQQAANEIFGWANGALILGATLVLAGTIAAFWTNGIREKYSDERIANNEAETAIAKVAAAKATERASEADNKTEAERLERVKLEARVAPRRLDSEELEELRIALVPFARKRVVISSYAFDTDGIVLAEQIQQAVLLAGLPVVNEIGAHIPAHAPIIEGVKVAGRDADLVEVLKRTLLSTGIALDRGVQPGTELLEFKEPPDVVATIYVGAKPIAAK